MAKLSMSRITVAASQDRRKELLEFVQRRGLLEITEQEEASFHKTDTGGQIALFERNAASAEAALNILDTHCPEKTGLLDGFKGRKIISVSEYQKTLAFRKRVFDDVGDIQSLAQQQSECRAEIARLTGQLAELEPWLTLDIRPDISSTLRTAVFVGSVPFPVTGEEFTARLEEKLGGEEQAPGFTVECVSSARELTALVVVTNRIFSEQVSAGLRALGFTRPSVLGKELPSDQYERLRQRKEALERDVDTLESLYAVFSDQRSLIRFFADYYRMRADKYEMLGRLLQTRNTFIITGYVPEKYAGKLGDALEQRFDAAVELEPADPADPDTPVALENGGFSRPVQSIVEMYSMPGPEDVDPTGLVALFYYFFFGMMLSDAGYGLLMVLGAGYLLWKFPLEEKTRNSMKMFLYCGICTIFWGLMYGSFFGDAVKVISGHFFGHEITLKPLWLDPVSEPLTLLIVSIGLGFFQIFVGLGAEIYRQCKQGHPLDALLDVASWYLVLGGMVAWLAGVAVGWSTVGRVGMIVFLVGIGILIIFGGRKSPTLIGKIVGGIPKLYSITSYVSDALSYSRLMALGLATGVIGQVFNLLASMGGNNIIGFLLFIVIFAAGHGINFGINALGAYVHDIRLQYVEFFGKFFEGGGRPFSPFSANTKYIRFKED